MHGEDYWSMPICSSAHDSEARAVVDEIRAVKIASPATFGAILRAGGLARALCDRARRLEWRGAVEVAPSAVPAHRWRSRSSPVRWARRAPGKPRPRRPTSRKLAALRDKLRERRTAIGPSRSTSRWQVANAWVLNAEGKHDEALQGAERSRRCRGQDREAPVTPGPLAPARELYGQMLLERGNGAEASRRSRRARRRSPIASTAMRARRCRRKARRQAQAPRRTTRSSWRSPGRTADRREISAARQYLASN